MNRLRQTLFLTLFLLAFLGVLGLSQSHIKNSNKNVITNDSKKRLVDYSQYFTEESPGGKWVVAAAVDVPQRLDGEVPVVIDGVRSLLGEGKFVDLIVKRVTLINRT